MFLRPYLLQVMLASVALVVTASVTLSIGQGIRLLIDSGFSFLSGEDGTAVAYNAAGGNGCISVTANVAPALCSEMQKACKGGDFAAAAGIQKRLMPLHMALFTEPSPAGIKYAASLLGLCDEYCRLPIVPLSHGARSEIRDAMSGLDLI